MYVNPNTTWLRFDVVAEIHDRCASVVMPVARG
jgi:hypothetical protein